MANLHEHTAEKLPDGRIVVRNLPVLAEERSTDPRFRREFAFRSRLAGKAAKPRDRKWLEKCRAQLMSRVKTGYKIPLTFRHSDDNPELAGEIIPTKALGLTNVNPGEDPRPTLFADHYFNTPAAYAEFKKKYPYRSPELGPDYPDEIDALALLSAEAPYNKFATPVVKELFRASPFYRSKRGVVAGDVWSGKTLMRSAPVEKQASGVVDNWWTRVGNDESDADRAHWDKETKRILAEAEKKSGGRRDIDEDREVLRRGSRREKQAVAAGGTALAVRGDKTERMYSEDQTRDEGGMWSGGGGGGGGGNSQSPQGSFSKDKKGRTRFTPHPEAVKKIQAEREAMVRAKNEKQAAEVSPMGDAGIAEEPKVAAAGDIDVSPEGSTTEMTLGQLGGKLDKLIELHTKGMGELMTCMKSMVEGGKKPTETMAAEGSGDEPGGSSEEKLETMAADDDEEGPGEPTAQPAVYRALKVIRAENEKFRAARASDAKALATLQGEVSGLRKVSDQRKAVETHQTLVTKTTDRLVAMGFDLTPSDRAEIEKHAKQGQSSIDGLVAGYSRALEHAAPSIGTYGEALAADASEGADLPEEFDEEVAAAYAKGGKSQQAIKTLYRSWQAASTKDKNQLFGGKFANFVFERDTTGKRRIVEKG